MRSHISCLLTALAVLSLFACTGGQQKNGEQEGPKIHFKSTTHNFGKLQIGTIISHTFTFTNTGNATLKIERIETSCGCTVPETPKKVIAPGESGKIRIEFDTSGILGKQEKAIQVYTNSPGKISHLTIKANIN